jgi:hypothetical protein
MTLTKNTKINSVLFFEKSKQGKVVFSANLNMTFSEYLKSCKKPVYSSNQTTLISTNINKMLGFNYILQKSIKSQGYTMKWYAYEDNDFICSFIELT